jgi:hypothetical protein
MALESTRRLVDARAAPVMQPVVSLDTITAMNGATASSCDTSEMQKRQSQHDSRTARKKVPRAEEESTNQRKE